MKYKKLVITLLLAVFLMIQIVNGEDWFRYGSDHQKSFVYDSDYRGDFYNTTNVTESTNQPEKISLYSPLVADLDGDGQREIIIVNNQEIRLYRGANYELVDVEYFSWLNPTGQMEVVDFITGGNDELMVTVKLPGAGPNYEYSLRAINWNGTDFILSKYINWGPASTGYSPNGLNCRDIDADAKVECMFFDVDGRLFAYDESDSSTTSFKVYLAGGCPNCSIPHFIDYDGDGDDDIFAIWGASGNKVIKIRNDGSETFTYIHTYNFTNPVNQIAKIDLDGGQQEIVITSSESYNGAFGTSQTKADIDVFGADDNLLKCNYGSFQQFYMSPSLYAAPTIVGLHTCHEQEGTLACDYDSDSYNEIWVVTAYSGKDYDEIRVFDYDCSLLHTYDIDPDVKPTSGAFYTKAVWANLDSDTPFEIIYDGHIFDKDGSLVNSFVTDSDMLTVGHKSYFIVAEVTNDTTNDIIYQNANPGNEIHVYSTIGIGYCTDSDGGVDYLTKGYVTDNIGTNWDYCVGNTLKEQYCFGGYSYSIDKDCTDYGSGYICNDGKCQIGCTSPSAYTGQYWCTIGYVYYCDPPGGVNGWDNYKICGLAGSNETGNCVVEGSINDTAEGICELAECYDVDGSNYLYKGYVNYNDSTYYDYCSGSGYFNVTEYICVGGVLDTDVKDCTDYGSEYMCSDGKCTLAPINCTDSDGTNYFNKGWVYDGPSDYTYWDACENNVTLWEKICGTDGIDVIEKSCKFFGSLYMCYDGACIEQPTNCTDSDGVDYWTKGYVTDITTETVYWDFCFDSTKVTEFICSGEAVSSVVENCQDWVSTDVCSDGKCIPVLDCTDGDGGLDYYTKGTVTILSGSYTDYCLSVQGNDNYVAEYYCEDDGGLGLIANRFCEFDCVDGACVDISPVNPMQADLDSPWYRDVEGNLKFNSSKCVGWKSMIMCAGWKYSINKVATGASWVFSGIHILYFIIILIIIIIIGPLIVEFFKPRK